MVSALASSWPSPPPPEPDTLRKNEESLMALKALVRDCDLLSRGWLFCCGCSSTGFSVGGADADASASVGADSGFCGAGSGSDWTLAGDWALGGDWLTGAEGGAGAEAGAGGLSVASAAAGAWPAGLGAALGGGGV